MNGLIKEFFILFWVLIGFNIVKIECYAPIASILTRGRRAIRLFKCLKPLHDPDVTTSKSIGIFLEVKSRVQSYMWLYYFSPLLSSFAGFVYVGENVPLYSRETCFCGQALYENYSTVTDFAKFRGLSGSIPRRTEQ